MSGKKRKSQEAVPETPPSQRKTKAGGETPSTKGSASKANTKKAVPSSSTKTTPTSQRTKIRKESKDKILTPGSSGEIKSFIDIHQQEAQVAAYCGYDDVADLRRYLLSHHFLKHFLKYAGQWSESLHRKRALGFISDMWLDERDESTFPLDDETCEKYFRDVYTEDQENLRSKRLAHILIVFVEDVGTNAGGNVSIDTDRQLDAKFKFGKIRKDCEVANIHIIGNVKLPRFDFPEHNDLETGLEKYNRAWMLLKHMINVSNPNTFNKRFKGSWEASKKIDASYIPTWMRARSSLAQKPKNPLADAHKELSRVHIPIDVTVKTGGVSKSERDALAEYKDANDSLDFPEGVKSCQADPRVHSLGQFRDDLRRLFGCSENGLQISKARMIIPRAPNVGEDEEELSFDLYSCDWEQLRRHLKLSFENGPQPSPLKVNVWFRPREEDEELYDAADIPLPQLEDLFAFADGDIIQTSNTQEPADDAEDNAEEHEEFFAATQQRSKKASAYTLDPFKKFDGDNAEADFLEHFDGHDVRTDQGLLKWQRNTLESICDQAQKPIAKKPKPKSKKVGKNKTVASAELLRKLEEAATTGALAAMSDAAPTTGDASTEDADLNYFAVQGAFTGTEAQTGPPLETCVTVMGMELAKEGDTAAGSMYRCKLLDMYGVKRTFHPYQVTGACFMLLRLFGTVPLPPDHAARKEVKEALARLQRLQTYGCVLADATGLGKTIETLLAMAFARQFFDTEVDCPFLLMVPANAVLQWAREIDKYWKCFALAISYDKDALESSPKLKQYVVSAAAVKELPKRDRLNRTRDSGHDLSYLFDGSTRNKGTIFLTSLDTQYERLVFAEEVTEPAESYDPPQYDDDGHETLKKEERIIHQWNSAMIGQFFMTVIDEAHTIKNPATKNWATSSLAGSEYTILITATPMQNTSGDFIGLLMILWNKVNAAIEEDAIAKEFAEKCGKGWRKAYEDIYSQRAYDIISSKDLVIMDPHRCASLLKSGDPNDIQRHFHLLDDLVTLRRSAASTLKVDDEGSTYQLRNLMKPHTIETVLLERSGAQELVYQWLHRDAAERYVKQIQASRERDRGPEAAAPLPGGGIPISIRSERIVYPIVPLRDLDIANASTVLARFNLIMRQADKSTLVAQTDHWRSEGIDGEDLVDFVRRKGDRTVETRADYLKMLCESSPILVAIFRTIRQHVLKGEKLLVLEQVPLIAWFWELCCKLLHIKTATMHADLDQSGRARLMDDFNASGGLRILILMYDVGGQAINLQRSCHRAFIAHPGISHARVEQAKGRIIRGKHEVTVTNAFIKNSHSTWRVYKLSGKVLAELATRAHDPEVREVLVDLLRRHAQECAATLETEEGKMMKEYLLLTGQFRAEKPTSAMAGTFDDLSENLGGEDEAQNAQSRPKRKITAIDRFTPYAYGGPSGRLIKDAEQRRRAEEKGARKFYSQALDTAEGGDVPTDDDDGDFEPSKRKSDVDDDEETNPYKDSMKQIAEAELAGSNFSDELQQLAAKVQYEPTHEYTDSDLNEPLTLRRALLLLYKERMDQPILPESANIHIRYNTLPIALSKKLEKLANTSQKDAKLFATHFTTVKEAPKSTFKKPIRRIAKQGSSMGTATDTESEDSAQVKVKGKDKGKAPVREDKKSFWKQSRLHKAVHELCNQDPAKKFFSIDFRDVLHEAGVGPRHQDELIDDEIFVGTDWYDELPITVILDRLEAADDARFEDLSL